MTAQILQSAALTLLAYMCLMYLVGLLARDNSLVDIAYGPAFVVAGWSAWWQAGALKPEVHAAFRLEGFRDAMAEVRARRSAGRVILTP